MHQDIQPGTSLPRFGARWDLIVNVDSLTEFGRELATQDLERIGEIGDCSLSVNHEANEYCVRDLHEEARAFARCERMR